MSEEYFCIRQQHFWSLVCGLLGGGEFALQLVDKKKCFATCEGSNRLPGPGASEEFNAVLRSRKSKTNQAIWKSSCNQRAGTVTSTAITDTVCVILLCIVESIQPIAVGQSMCANTLMGVGEGEHQHPPFWPINNCQRRINRKRLVETSRKWRIGMRRRRDPWK